MKRVTILGATGSIGTQTLDVISQNPDDFEVVALTASESVEKMAELIQRFCPSYAVMKNEEKAEELRKLLPSHSCEILYGMDGFVTVSTLKNVDVVVAAMVGMIGLRPVMEAIRAGKDIALANKETLVTAGHIIMPLAKEYGVSILPVDSEHSAIFQSLNGERVNKIEKILLTASGGPFRGKTRAELEKVTLEDALRHPNWSMGKKITVDSSTLVNKGLEVMEAKWLFGVEPEQIQVVVQPQSVIHSMVQYEDGSIIAQLGTPDMRLPIQYALYYPRRRPLDGRRLDFAALGSITFEEPDTQTFRGLPLAYQAMKKGGNMPTVFNAANEAAVALFLQEKISYLQITEIIEECMQHSTYIESPGVEQILATEAEVRERIESR